MMTVRDYSKGYKSAQGIGILGANVAGLSPKTQSSPAIANKGGVGKTLNPETKLACYVPQNEERERNRAEQERQ
jgi:hypothetical protein